jgi:multiple sugar transport system substrate-binding protein
MAGLVAVLGLSRTSDQISSKLGKGPVQINFWNGFTGPDGRTMLEIIRRFNQEHPDIRVSMQRMDWATYYNKLIVSEMDGRGPEMFIIHASTLPRMVRTGFVDDVSDAFSGSSAIPENDFDPYVLKQLDFDGKRVGVALDIHPQGLYCNKQMLKEVGAVDQNGNPKAPETGDEFVNVLTQMIKRSGGSVDQWGFALTLWRNNFQSLIPQFGGRFLDENGNADLNNPGNVRALEFLGSLTKNKLVPPPENGLGWVGYRQKKVGMVWDGAYMLGDLKRLQDLEYLAAPIPQIGPQPGTLADSHVMCIKKGLSEKERSSALTFMKYLSEHSLEWADAGQVPARRSVCEASAAYDVSAANTDPF